MTEYKIIPDGLRGVGVEITSIGRFLSVRGFAAEIAVIAEQERAEALAAHAIALPGVPESPGA
jgi:hypothetical protein